MVEAGALLPAPLRRVGYPAQHSARFGTGETGTLEGDFGSVTPDMPLDWDVVPPVDMSITKRGISSRARSWTTY